MAGSFIFGSSNLSSFIFNFLGSPFKSLQRRLAPPDLEDSQPTSEAEAPLEDDQVEEPTPAPPEPSQQDSPTTSQMAPPVSFENSLPTAFMPNFPSLSRRSISQPDQSVISSAPPTRLIRSTENRPPSRRSFYIGPGHSSMNPSTRLSVARRKRLGMSKSSNALGSNYDALSQAPPDSPKGAPLLSSHPQDFAEGHTPKRVKVNNHRGIDFDPSSPFQNQLQCEPPPSNQMFSHPPKVENSTLRAIKSSHMTPMIPSPLRNVTLPSAVSSPASQRDSSPAPPTSIPKKRTHKKAASIMSSVMKEVNLEITNRSPAPSPIKPSNVINPYSHLQQRPMRNKPTSQPVPVKKSSVPPPPPTENLQERENRKRKVQVCLDGGDVANLPSDLDQSSSANSNQNPIEQILQKTMPKEFCPERTSSSRAPKKTRQVGKLPERVLKKQKLREQGNKGSSISNDNTSNNHQLLSNKSNQATSSPSVNNKPSEIIDLSSSEDNNVNLLGSSISKSSQVKPNQPNNSKPTSPIKTFQQIPSVSLFGTSNLTSKTASTRSSLLNAKHQPTVPTLNKDNNQKNDIISNVTFVPDSSTKQNSAKDNLFLSSYSRVEKEKRSEEKENMEGTEEAKGIEKEKKGGSKEEKREEEKREEQQEQVGEEEKRIMKLVKEFKPEEIQKYFNEDLLKDYSHQRPTDSDELIKNNNILDVDFQSIKEVVLGLSSNELTSFVLV